MLWIQIVIIVFGVQRAQGFAGGGIVAHGAHVLRGAINVQHHEVPSVRLPCNVGEVLIGRCARAQEHRVASHQIVYANGDVVARLTSHGIADLVEATGLLPDVFQHVRRHHRLVHAVEREAISVGSPENSLHDTVLLAVYALSVHDAIGAIGGNGFVQPLAHTGPR